jgi:putative transposase
MNRSYKYLLKPTAEQQATLNQWFGCARWIWNAMLAANIAEYATSKKFVWAYEFNNQIPQLKKQNPWLADIPSQALQQRCADLQKSLKRTSRSRTKRSGFPHFKSKRNNTQSLRIPQQSNQIKIADRHIHIPKMGAIKWVYHRPVQGTVKSVTIKLHNDRYWIVVTCELPNTTPQPIDRATCVGIDLGLTTFAVLSDGTEIATPKLYRSKQQKLKRAQRRLARKQKSSANRRRALKQVRRIHERIANQRHNFIHQHSRQIANAYSGVYVENLDIESIKQRYGKSTSDQGWAMFVSALAYKCNHLGRIDRWAASTKTCSSCGAVHQLSLADREIICDCGHHQSRDLNAARNICIWGQLSTDVALFSNTSGTGEIHACGDMSQSLDCSAQEAAQSLDSQ